jgi:hypothetical protein
VNEAADVGIDTSERMFLRDALLTKKPIKKEGMTFFIPTSSISHWVFSAEDVICPIWLVGKESDDSCDIQS